MTWFLVLFLVSSTRAFVMVKMHQNAFFEPTSDCAFIDDVIFSSDGTIQSCIWECVHTHSCQTAVYYENSKLCSMFDERCENGHIVPEGDDPSTVICYPKNDNPTSTCSLDVTEDYNDNVTIPHVTIASGASVLTLLTGKNEKVYGIWKTKAGGNSKHATYNGNYPTYHNYEAPKHAFDLDIYTKYYNFARSSSGSNNDATGIDTGFYITPKRGLSLLKAVQLYAANDQEGRDPWTMTIEGTNRKSPLTVGSSWNLIYNGSTGLNNSTPRYGAGAMVWLPNNATWYSSYRVLMTSKRGASHGVQYSEVKFFI